jgi:serine/threonine protein kinase
MHGQSLARRVRDLAERSERLPIAMALHICVQVADVLGMAHAQGIAHRDIKPDNLMIVGDPVAPGGERVKVLDFGIAKLSDVVGGVKTATDQVMGTPAYMSPEQCAGAGGVDAQTDVYALGCVLYELLAGRTPFVADGAGRLIGMHLFQEPPLLLSVAPQVPRAIAELVHRMLRKETLQRLTLALAAAGRKPNKRIVDEQSCRDDLALFLRERGHEGSIGHWLGDGHTRRRVDLLVADLIPIELKYALHEKGADERDRARSQIESYAQHAAEGLNLYAQCWADASLTHGQRHGGQWVGCDGSDPYCATFFDTPPPAPRWAA